MKRRHFLAAAPAVVIASCARDKERGPRYDPKECPFCTTKKGVCSYCRGTKKCTFCGGTGKRKNVVPNLPEENIKASSYEEQCPFCGGKGECRYCKATGVCWACGGSGKIESWDFFSKPGEGK
jgi:RecJ-like exonuclease